MTGACIVVGCLKPKGIGKHKYCNEHARMAKGKARFTMQTGPHAPHDRKAELRSAMRDEPPDSHDKPEYQWITGLDGRPTTPARLAIQLIKGRW